MSSCESNRITVQRIGTIGICWTLNIHITVEDVAQNLVVHCHSGVRVRSAVLRPRLLLRSRADAYCRRYPLGVPKGAETDQFGSLH